MRVEHLPASSQRRVPWKNGRGFTTEICSDADQQSPVWSWRLSIADVPEAAPFSSFPGIDRHIMCLSGKGMRVRVDGTWHTVPSQGDAFTFSGDAVVVGEPDGEGVRDVNLMVARARWAGQLRALHEGQQISLKAGSIAIVHAGRGDGEFQSGAEMRRLIEGSSALITGVTVADEHHASVTGLSGELVVAVVHPKSFGQ